MEQYQFSKTIELKKSNKRGNEMYIRHENQQSVDRELSQIGEAT